MLLSDRMSVKISVSDYLFVSSESKETTATKTNFPDSHGGADSEEIVYRVSHIRRNHP